MPRRAYNDTSLRAPFPWFGGKSRVAHLVWDRFGDVPNYVEPFFGSGAVMLARPHPARIETINDLDCYVSNFWRALQRAPEEVALDADSPVNTECIGVTGIFLDAPYGGAERDTGIYSTDNLQVAGEVREWAIAHGDNEKLRIALCGYQGEHVMPKNWTCLEWKANGGHGNAAQGRGRANATRERIWFSPHCLVPRQPELEF